MASITTGLIEKVQIDSDAEQNIASTAYGECTTGASSAAKTVEMTGFSLLPGVTVHIKFIHENTANNPTLNINSTGAKPIVQFGTTAIDIDDETSGWHEGAVLTLTYDGTSWIRDQGYNTDTIYIHPTTDGNLHVPAVGTTNNGKFLKAGNTEKAFGWSFITKADITDFEHSHALSLAENAGTSALTLAFGKKYQLTAGGSTYIFTFPEMPTPEDLDLSKVMHFIGVATVPITDGSTTDPVISGYSTKTAGDVIIDKDSSREFVWSTTNKWELLGGDSSYKVTQTAVTTTTAETTADTVFVSSVTQNENGEITVKTRPLDTSGTWEGNAVTATTASKLSGKPTLATSNTTKITVTVGGQKSSAFTVPYSTQALRLKQSTISDLSSFTHTTDLIYAADGGNNTVTDKPTGVDAFGVLSYKVADGWYGQLLTSANTEPGLYWRAATTLSGAWKKVLDSDNYADYTVTKTGTGASGTWGISVTGTAANVTGTVAIEHGGTGQTTLTAARQQFSGPEFIVGTWTAASGTWTGTTTDSELYDGKQIILYMPFAGHGNATLNLTLADGTTTGAKNVYFESTTPFTTHKGQNAQLHLIYHSALTLSNGNTYEGWWYIANRDTDNDYRVRQTIDSANKTYSLLFSSLAIGTATNNTAYITHRNDLIYVNPSLGAVYATSFHGALTGNVSGNADTATAAHLTTTTNAIAYYTNTTGTFGSKASANGALYATSTNGALQWGILPIAQGGTNKSEWTNFGIVYTDSDGFKQITAGAMGNKEQVLISNGAAAPDWYSGLSLAGTAEASYIATFKGTTASTSTTSGALQVTGGLGVAGQVTAERLAANGSDTSYNLYVNGTSYLNGNTTVNGDLIPGANNTKTLGSTDAKWAKLYIGSDNNYGDAYTPIYWNNGTPTVITPIQYCDFTIGSGKKGVKLMHAAFTKDSYVTQIVIINGESNLNSVIEWESAAGYINLTCSATSGAVSGYILVSRGGAITVTATDIT